MKDLKLCFYIYQQLLLSVSACTKYFVSIVQCAAGWAVHFHFFSYFFSFLIFSETTQTMRSCGPWLARYAAGSRQEIPDRPVALLPLHSLASVGKPKMAGEAEDMMLTGWDHDTAPPATVSFLSREPGGRDRTLTICGDCTSSGDCELECGEMGPAEATSSH